ncbi:hypothetical protein CBR_g11932 [Chara braunii]|uniref:Uncharacterized protein n=1 Tax=Chara braunii TaxID=69332 RepID=A0A388KQM8_CHABU|nr:hypothetical protein CBR_g3572 [Chara braunii]GBG72355.1 hypothetical protein CBR_g11932 [Chara braunii]|eukprot:GBG68874.1 hypothetical protein CBR_g3572 [Chara braunii]
MACGQVLQPADANTFAAVPAVVAGSAVAGSIAAPATAGACGGVVAAAVLVVAGVLAGGTVPVVHAVATCTAPHTLSAARPAAVGCGGPAAWTSAYFIVHGASVPGTGATADRCTVPGIGTGRGGPHPGVGAGPRYGSYAQVAYEAGANPPCDGLLCSPAAVGPRLGSGYRCGQGGCAGLLPADGVVSVSAAALAPAGAAELVDLWA